VYKKTTKKVLYKYEKYVHKGCPDVKLSIFRSPPPPSDVIKNALVLSTFCGEGYLSPSDVIRKMH
jgi:hypothetical protein